MLAEENFRFKFQSRLIAPLHKSGDGADRKRLRDDEVSSPRTEET